MFNRSRIRQGQQASAVSESPCLVEELQQRIAELEAENAYSRHLNETLRRNAHLFDTLLDRSQEGILLVTPEMTVLRLIHSVLGYSDSEVVGHSILSVIHPADADSVCAHFAQLLDAKLPTVACKFRACRANGNWITVDAEMTDLLDDPDVQAIVLNCRLAEG